MPYLDPASMGLAIMGSLLVGGIGAAGLGMFLSDHFRCRRDRRNLNLCMETARREAELIQARGHLKKCPERGLCSKE